MSTFSQRFASRMAAGIQLAHVVQQRSLRIPAVVLGLPPGGVPVAYEIARALQTALDVMPVCKIGMPGNPEVAIGAVAGKTVVRESNLATYVPTGTFEQLARLERAELRRRERIYRPGLPALTLEGMEVLLVDDSLATGSTMIAAVREARRLKAEIVSVATPVASDDAEALVRAEADKTIVLKISVELSSVGAWYDDFSPIEDSEVCRLLAQCRPAAKLLSYAT